jgi:hypothetical protein
VAEIKISIVPQIMEQPLSLFSRNTQIDMHSIIDGLGGSRLRHVGMHSSIADVGDGKREHLIKDYCIVITDLLSAAQ